MSKIKVVFSNDDIGLGDEVHVRWFNEVVAYLNGRGIPGTFFWVPLNNGVPSDQTKSWMKAIEAAMKAGHDIQWHGLTHDCLEFGAPQDGLRKENPEAFRRYEAEPMRWDYEHSRPRIKEKLEAGLKIFQRNFGRPVIFRSPCIGVCDALYQGLAELGVRYSSSRVINPQSWVFTATMDPQLKVWDPEFSPYPFKILGVTEMPLMTDYCHLGLPDDRRDEILSLAKSDYQHVFEECHGAVIMLSHYHSMHKGGSHAWEKTVQFYDNLLDFQTKNYDVEYVTFKQLCG